MKASILFSVLLFFGSLHASYQTAALLPSTESDPDAFVDHCVNTINGDYCEAATDVIIAAPDPLALRRFYNARNYLTGLEKGGWRLMPEALLVLGKDPQPFPVGLETLIAFVGERSGSILTYSSHSSEPLKIVPETALGMVNTYAKELSGKTNHLNNRLYLKGDSCELILGDGTKRLYQKKKSVPTLLFGEEMALTLASRLADAQFFQLVSEILPSGNTLLFTYDLQGRLSTIEMKNRSQNNTHAWIRFSYVFHEQGCRVLLTTSDEKTLTYHFENESGTYLLKTVECSYGMNHSYTYDSAHRLIRKTLPEGRFVEVVYNSEGKVSALLGPSPSGESETLHTFIYGEDFTDHFDTLNLQTRYQYNNRFELTAVERFDDSGTLYRTDRRYWGTFPSQLTHLLSRTIEDGEGQVHSYRTFTYDNRGNILEEKLYGHLTGKKRGFLEVDSQGQLLNIDETECHTKSFSYSDDGFNLLTRLGDCKGNQTLYTYKKDSNLLLSKFIYDKKEVKKRTFHTYNDDAVCTLTVEDDGSKEDPTKIIGWGVTERHLTHLTPRETLPGVGLPHVIKECAHDLKSNQEIIISKWVNTYSPQGHLISSDRYDSHNTYAYTLYKTYNNLGEITSETDPAGNQTLYTYDGCGNKTCTSIPHQNRTVEYLYDFKNYLIKTIETAEGTQAVQNHGYDSLGRKIFTTDRFGQTTYFSYDPFGRLIQVVHPTVLDENEIPIQPTFTYTYDIFGNVLSTTDPKGYTIYKKYNLRGDPTRIFYPDGSFELFKYDTEGSLHRSMTRDQIITIYEYDYLGRPIYEERNTTGEAAASSFAGSQSFKYNGFRVLAENYDQRITRYKYDPAGRVIATFQNLDGQKDNDPETRIVEIVYDPLGRESKKKVWFDAGPHDYSWECLTYDLLGRITEKWIENHEGQVLLKRGYLYNARGECIEEYAFAGNQLRTLHQTEYDPFGEPISQKDALGNETQIHIDYSGDFLKKTLIAPTGVQTQLMFDPLGRLSSLIKKDPFGVLLFSQRIFYDGTGNKSLEVNDKIVEGTWLEEQRTRWVYGPMGRVDKEIEGEGTPEERVTLYSFNNKGQISAQSTEGSLPLEYEYNKKGRLYKIKHTSSKPDLQITNSFSYDRRGNIHTAHSLTGKTVERHYNPFDQVIKEYIQDGEGQYTLQYQYDRKGRLKGVTLPDGSRIAYTYNALYGKGVKRLSAKGEALFTHTYDDYDEMGKLLEETLIGQLGKRKTTYDLLGKKTGIHTDLFTEAVPEGGYNPSGQLLEVKKTGLGQKTASYSYNDLSQLVSEKTSQVKIFAYDSLDNFRKAGDEEFYTNSLNQLIRAGNAEYSYDPQGNLLKKALDGEETHFESNRLSHLIWVKKSDQTALQNSYDPFGRRVVKKLFNTSGKYKKTLSTTRSFYIGYHELGTLDDQGNIQTLRIPGLSGGETSLKSVAIEIQKKLYAPLHDGQGNLIALVDPATRQVVESYTYTAFGEERIFDTNGDEASSSLIGNTWRYAEKPIDEETGLVNFGLRYYDPAMGRWITRDPAAIADGPNPYAYLRNNPVNALDRFGLTTENESEKHEGYMYGELETHCFCERHRTCKRGGDMWETLGEDPHIVAYSLALEEFRRPSEIMDLGLPELEDMEIGFINGIWNSERDALKSARYISRLAGGCNVHMVYSPCRGYLEDPILAGLALKRSVSEPIRLLQSMWNSFFERSSSTAKYLMICHSAGAIHVRNALMSYPPELRERIIVVAIAPGGYIYKQSCAQVKHYRAEENRDFVPYIDSSGAERGKDTTVTLKSDPLAKRFDHEFKSPTYKRALWNAIQNYKSGRLLG